MTPTLFDVPTWECRARSDWAARSLADRHYNRHTIGAKTVGPPGRVLTFVTVDNCALWQTHYPRADLALDGLDALRCSTFRNEGPNLSSTLILEAMQLTRDLWPDVSPVDGWATYVDPRRVRSSHPGYCYIAAGWRRDRSFKHRHLIRLRCDL